MARVIRFVVFNGPNFAVALWAQHVGLPIWTGMAIAAAAVGLNVLGFVEGKGSLK